MTGLEATEPRHLGSKMPYLIRTTFIALLFVLHMGSSASANAAGIRSFTLSYIGQQIVPSDTRFKGTLVGGLSSLDYNPLTGHYLAVSDDRSKKNPARFYELSLDLAQFQRSASPGMSGVVFDAVTVIQRPGGGAFKKNSVDPEGMRLDVARNKIYWSNEGQRGLFGFRRPTVSEINLDGSHNRGFAVPSYYLPGKSDIGIFPGGKGVYDNLGFESLAISVDGTTLYTATENGLVQDSPPANAYTGSRARVLAFDIASGQPCGEYIYEVEPVAIAPPLLGPFATNGLTDLVAVGNQQFITVERSFTPTAVIPGNGTGYTVRLYYADARKASDIFGFESIAGKSIEPMRKVLLLDLSELKNEDGSTLVPGNVEGITFGPDFNGKRTLILVADNNFSRTQLTQFIALELEP
jgi:hypothetical protein